MAKDIPAFITTVLIAAFFVVVALGAADVVVKGVALSLTLTVNCSGHLEAA